MEKCGTLLDAVQDTLVLAVEVADKTLLNSPQMIRKVLDDPKIRTAIEQAALSEARRLAEAQKAGKTITNEDGKQLATKVGKAAGDAALESVKSQIENSDEFKKLKKEVEKIGCAFKKSSIGVFVDKHKGWLIVVGVGVGLGGATAMYVFRGGDVVAEQGLNLANKHLRFKVLGNVELGASNLKFVPSKRQIATTMFASAKWERVSVRLDLSVDFKEKTLQSAGGKVTTDITVAKGLILTGVGSAGYQLPTEPWQQKFVYHLGVGLTYKKAFGLNKFDLSAKAFIEQTPELNRQGAQLKANYNILKLPDKSQLNIGVTGEASNNQYFNPIPDASRRSGTDLRGMVVLEWRHDLFGGGSKKK